MVKHTFFFKILKEYFISNEEDIKKKPDSLGVDVLQPATVFGNGFQQLRGAPAQVNSQYFGKVGCGQVQVFPRLFLGGDKEHFSHVQVLRPRPSQVAGE